MAGTVRDTAAMISGMSPRLDPEHYVFCTTTDERLISAVLKQARASFIEDEGMSLILPQSEAVAHGFASDLVMCRIVLEVNSSLEGVGLTAAVASALAQEGISCNMVAAYHHDHVFIPVSDAERAMACLRARAAAS